VQAAIVTAAASIELFRSGKLRPLESLIDRFLKQVSQVFTLRVFDFRTTS
jgi:hypothetical protein